MYNITFENIKLEGITYQKIIDIQIVQNVGEHAKALLVIENLEDTVMRSTLRGNVVKVICEKNGDIECIFCGYVLNDMPVDERGYNATQIELASMSKVIDSIPVTATYQKTSRSYQELMELVVEGKAIIYFGITDSKIGGWQYRNNETAWEFVKRLASGVNAQIITNMSTKVPIIHIGKTDKKISEELTLIETYELNGEIVYRVARVLEVGMQISSNEFVLFAKTYMNNGILVTDFILGEIEKLQVETYYNAQSECRMITGTVQDVDGEKVRVFFDSIDNSFEADGDNWFEYATPYATGGGEYGSGFYVMPEQGDRVRVFLPSADESKAFAFGTVSDSVMSNPEFARWKMPGNQEILFTDRGLRISCEGISVYIDMTAEGGIDVWSQSQIALEKTKVIEIEGKQGVIIHADNLVAMGASESNMIMENDKIVLQAVNLIMN